jgi:hypothetical protein
MNGAMAARAIPSADADSGKRRFWGRNTMVAGQVALSLVLLVVSAVLVEGFRHELQRHSDTSVTFTVTSIPRKADGEPA